jgi:hypothetical protein
VGRQDERRPGFPAHQGSNILSKVWRRFAAPLASQPSPPLKRSSSALLSDPARAVQAVRPSQEAVLVAEGGANSAGGGTPLATYARGVRASLGNNAAAFAYSAMITASFGVLTSTLGPSGVVDVFVFASQERPRASPSPKGSSREAFESVCESSPQRSS